MDPLENWLILLESSRNESESYMLLEVYGFTVKLLIFLISAYASIHALIYKKDPRSAISWIAVSILLPIIGPLLYFLFGINRVHSRARKLSYAFNNKRNQEVETANNLLLNKQIPESLTNLEKVSKTISTFPLTGGNEIVFIDSGTQAYEAMLEAIKNAKKYIYLCVYIFNADVIGQKFIAALKNARDKGVKVQVLIDGIGQYYSRKNIIKILRSSEIEVCLFLPPKLFPFNFNINLRNHRKLLVIDDSVSFVGGLNITDRYYIRKEKYVQAYRDVQFKCTGELVLQLKSVFELDWKFAGGILNSNNNHNVEHIDSLPVFCRTVINGPAENYGRLTIILLSAVNAATESIVIMTPYFLPNRELIGALRVAALRGINVSVILPEKNNLPYINWASRHMIWELLEVGIKIYYQPPPFSHTKLFVVDNLYSLIGSANIDARSLRLNYELAIQIYDKEFASNLNVYIQTILTMSEQVTLEQVDQRSLPIKIRDGIAWLFTPYL